jgi:hypothetical protein
MLATAAVVPAASAAVPALGPGSGAGARPSIQPTTQMLNSVFCTSSANCWTVGYRQISSFADLNQVLHWTGKKWWPVTVPSPGGAKANDFSELTSVRCTSAADCWAVGYYGKKQAELTQALHWNGRAWTLLHPPNPAGTNSGEYTELFDVACTSASSCWSVGDYGTYSPAGTQADDLAMHWNGEKWSQVKTPNPAGTSSDDENYLSAVRCASASDCWAVGGAGSELATFNNGLHWNGRKWSVADVPNPTGFFLGAYNALSGLACTSAKSCWAVGTYGSGEPSDDYYLNEALFWNGHNWTQVKTPEPDGASDGSTNFLAAVNCSSASNCWAVGQLGDGISTVATTNEVLHWKGTKWTKVDVPNPGGTKAGDQSKLFSIRCASAGDCWAVGDSATPGHPDTDQILHWDSSKWRVG